MMEITPDTVEVVPVVQHELSNIGLQSTREKRLPCLRRGTYLSRNELPFLKALASASLNGMG